MPGLGIFGIYTDTMCLEVHPVVGRNVAFLIIQEPFCVSKAEVLPQAWELV